MSGHLFVVHGRIENVVHDAAIIPTSTRFSLRPYWAPLLGEEREGLRPTHWPRDYARARGRSDVWFVNVGGRRGTGPEVIVQRAVAAVREIASTGPAPSRNRTKALVAIPVLGVGGGGLGHERGTVVRTLLRSLTHVAAEADIDIAVVTPDVSLYGAAQHLRRQEEAWPLPDDQLAGARRLGVTAREGQLALFMGAGVSIPAGLPTWSGLLAQLARAHQIDISGGFDTLNALDQAQYLHQQIEALGTRVAEVISERAVPSLGHTLLASLGCQEAVTTNYDRLYESAVRMQRGEDNVATVMPWEHPRSGKPWVLKLHGDVETPDSIVLTRDQFVRYDAGTRPAGALLQALLMTRHVLFVGASLTDDNVIRLAYEVDRFRRDHGLQGHVGTLLDVDADHVRPHLWRGQLDWLSMSGATIQERSRTLEIFLDAVAAYASSNASWLLDDRFRGLLDIDEELVSDARRLYRRVSAAGPEWQGLADVLLSFGAAAGESDEQLDSRRWRWKADLPK